jgi:hypothetical protein
MALFYTSLLIYFIITIYSKIIILKYEMRNFYKFNIMNYWYYALMIIFCFSLFIYFNIFMDRIIKGDKLKLLSINILFISGTCAIINMIAGVLAISNNLIAKIKLNLLTTSFISI